MRILMHFMLLNFSLKRCGKVSPPSACVCVRVCVCPSVFIAALLQAELSGDRNVVLTSPEVAPFNPDAGLTCHIFPTKRE